MNCAICSGRWRASQWEGERPREPKYFRSVPEVRAHGDARPRAAGIQVVTFAAPFLSNR